MKTGIYGRLAWSGIRKNKQLYIPYVITCIVMICMSYIVSFISESESVRSMHGGDSVCMTLGFGVNIILIFSVIFLFYTNSFLMRRRKKEFGLYNILGMNKRNICNILLCEMVIYCIISFVFGIIFGITLSKLAELILVNVINGSVSFEFVIAWGLILRIAVKYAVIFLVIFICNVIRIRFVNPIELLHSENVGEKPPKANWFVGALGLVVLVAAYCIAVTIEDPVAAMTWFFIAVLMVIVATYLIFIAGSVVMCRALQKNKRYYYRPNHFVSVSSMVYRMKRNGAGLASICILSTMVLVIMSTTSSMYYGAEDSIERIYTRDIAVNVGFPSYGRCNQDDIDRIKTDIDNCLSENNIKPDDIKERTYSYMSGVFTENVFYGNNEDIYNLDVGNYSDITQICIVPLQEYNEMSGAGLTLGDNELALYVSQNGRSYEYDTFEINGVKTYHIKKIVEESEETRESVNTIFKTYYLITDHPLSLEQNLDMVMEARDEESSARADMQWYYGWNLDSGEKAKSDIHHQISKLIKEYTQENDEVSFVSYSVTNKEVERSDFYGLYGGLLFLGIMLSIVFMFAAVLIIYYKQISEGYEDRHRFIIMKKVGMNNREIKKCINSQLLTVFFLPIIMAALHLGFAFPMLRSILSMIFLVNDVLLVAVTIGTLAVFAIGYMIVYYTTSKLYYGIVSSD